MKALPFRLALVAVASACALAAAGIAGAAGGSASGPSNGVWTCGYIAAHPAEAAAALVSCDPRGPVTAPGVAAASSFSPLGTPCARTPAAGDVSKGVFAWTGFTYFNYFSYSPNVVQLFTYYVQKQDGTNVQSGPDTQTNSHPVTAGANNYRLGAQNNGNSVQHWTFCWSVH